MTSSSGTSPVLGNFSSAGSSAGGSEIYRISRDGSPARIWSSRNDLVYSLAFDENGSLLAGTGNDGRIFQIRGEDQFTDLLKASASQITGFAHAGKNGLYASTSNLGKVFLLGATPAAEGTYKSDVFDAHIFSRWGRADVRGRGSVEISARSGNVDNPDRNWSPWGKVDWQKEAKINAPAARFIQWRAVLRAGKPAPRLESVSLNYLSRNVAPGFDDVTVEQGVRYQPGIKPIGDSAASGLGLPLHIDSPPSPIHDRASIGVKWTVHDDNDDQMIYVLYYRGEGEARWLPLKSNLSDKFYAFDSSLLPDGAYFLKVVASDAPSHSPGQALSAERESARFEVDTTPPRIEDIQGLLENNQIRLTFRAVDTFSPIQKAEYSVDAGDWQVAEPVGQISDSKIENYDVRIPLPKKSGSEVSESEHVVAVRAYDRHDNMASAKTVVSGK